MAGGRPKGKMSANKVFLLNKLKEMYGDDFHPIISMADNAVKLQEAADQEPNANTYKAAIDGWEKIAQYVEPKLKAVEVTGKDGDDLIPKSISIEYE